MPLIMRRSSFALRPRPVLRQMRLYRRPSFVAEPVGVLHDNLHKPRHGQGIRVDIPNQHLGWVFSLGREAALRPPRRRRPPHRGPAAIEGPVVKGEMEVTEETAVPAERAGNRPWAYPVPANSPGAP